MPKAETTDPRTSYILSPAYGVQDHGFVLVVLGVMMASAVVLCFSIYHVQQIADFLGRFQFGADGWFGIAFIVSIALIGVGSVLRKCA